jgi:hypothetical protein
MVVGPGLQACLRHLSRPCLQFKYVDTQFGMMDQISHMPPHYEYCE